MTASAHMQRVLDRLAECGCSPSADATDANLWPGRCPICHGRLEVRDVDWGENGAQRKATLYCLADDEHAILKALGIPERALLSDNGNGNGGAKPAVALLADSARLRLLDTLRLVTTEPPPLDWLADGIWCRGKLALLGGREKRGKSLVLLALAVLMASGGGEVAGITVKPGRVLLIDAENGEREIHRRLRAMRLAPEHAHNLLVAEARGFDLREHLGMVADLAQRHAVDLLLLDSFRALWRGDERDEAKVAAALDPLRELAHDTEIAISLIHHAQKGGDEYRGSSAIGACVEWCVMLDRQADDEDKTRRRLTNPLARFAPERPDRWLSICSDGDDGPVSLKAANAFVPERAAPVRDEIEAELRAWIRRVWGEVPVKEGHTPTPPPGALPI